MNLKVQGDPSDTQATVKYRRSPSDSAGWQNLPTGDVTVSGTAISSWPVTLSSGISSDMVWNAASTLGGTDGTPIELEVVLGTSPAVTTSPIELTLAIGGDTQPLGPGTVDLITGNFSLSASDVSFGDLGVGRSFDSRNPSGTSGDIFGPGWTSGIESSSGNRDDLDARRPRTEALLSAAVRRVMDPQCGYRSHDAADRDIWTDNLRAH